MLDVFEVEQNADGRYTLHVDVENYAKAFNDQWYCTPEGVLDAHDDTDFLQIEDRDHVVAVAQVIANEANAEIQRQYVEAPDTPIAEVVSQAYEEAYEDVVPDFELAIYGYADVVDADDLIKLWEEEHSNDPYLSAWGETSGS